MYTKITSSGGRRYLQLVEGYRAEAGRVRHRVVANLGRLDDITPQKLDPLISGLNWALGRVENTASDVVAESARAYGDVFALHELWRELGFDKAVTRALGSGKRKLDVEALVRAMVFNRLCDLASKLGCLRWLETVAMPAMPDTVTHQHLLRAMDALMDNAGAVEDAVARQIRPLVDHDLAVVFHDLTTVRIHGEGAVDDDLRAYRMNRGEAEGERGIARQLVLGVVQTADGLPLMHTVHPGNVGETKTLQGMLQTVLQRFPVQRVILVADRGLLSLDNIDELTAFSAQDGRQLEFILAVPARRCADLVETFQGLAFDDDGLAENTFAGHRLIVAHDPQRAAEQSERRRARIRDLQADRFSYRVDEDAIARAELFDRGLALLTNAPDLTPAETVTRYKSLADIERGFRVLKSDIGIAPFITGCPTASAPTP